ncbi:hypothetical protein E6R60_33075 [Streptomyces sp. A0642]|uniref:hypothetical protein n=1 Tax=Streptomyces sp. A0642 TaxID=2563100 RepID=UPI0010A25F0B|nr:hypothetical protein [Streptomyces sp. A0642]THA65353.1 hypothetical protein E6R60_33075 [Streptomyces sp. A0642]
MSHPVETVAAAPEPERRLGPIGRARASVTAIETLLRLREDQTQPTEDDLRVLRNWPGWGPLAPALAGDREGTWSEIGEQLQLLLSPRDYRHAEQGTPTAYYTPDRIADACWTALRDLGFNGGRVLEPGCGAGTFISHTPDRMPVQWYGVERDPTTAGIAALLHPNAQIINARFQDAGIQSNSVDAVLGNVPYGNFPVHDKTAPKAVTDSIHNYFIWRSVQAMRPGGVAILLTSRYTMDSADDSARRAIAKHADLLGAVRLPNGALAEGGTGVLADILIVRRRDTDAPVDDSWMEVTEVPTVSGQYVNDYFHRHPEHVLGEFEQGRAAQYGHTLAVKAPEDQDLTAALGGAFDSITAAARAAGREWRVAVGAQPFTEDTLPFPVREDGRKEGSFHLVEGKPHEVVDGELVAVERAGKELPKLIALRDAALKLIEAETNHDTPDEQLEPLRAEVNRLYDVYFRAHGAINRFTVVEGQVDEETGEKAVSRRYPRLGGFRRDPDIVSVLALEDFDDETQTAHKASLLTRRVNRRIERPTSAETPEEALSLCLNFKNKIDVPTIAQLLGIEEDQVPGTLGDLVFHEPDTGELLTKGAYLSGEVVDKLERAEFLLSQGRDDLQRHVDELRQVQPEPLPPEDIKAKLGAPWIPVEDVTAFAEEMLGVRVDIVHVAKTATWSVDQPMTLPEAATSEWGTDRVNAFELLDLALNGQAPKVYDSFRTPDGGSRRVRNDKATLLAESKQTALMRRFASWVWEDPDRADRLAADYNRIFNSWVLPKHDGSHLTVDGMDPEFKPYEHQWDFVQRVLSADEGSLCPYPVGAGKTATMFMTAVKLKQLGLVNKPMIVVPNHLLEQISRDGKKLFQNARILMAGKKDLESARSRMLFAARCATGDWDAIVMTHNSFGRLGVHPVTEATYLEELANEYRVALGAVDGEDGNQRRIKEIAKMVDRFDARATDLRSKAVDAGVTYENLGVDFLQVDEAHLFKNLALPATTEGMSLGKPSKRATDLDLKLIVTRERTGKENVSALYSGTFISNSVREMFVFKHYTMPKRLEKLGLASPDAWAANFIHFESRPEVGVDGVSFRLKRRPVEYTNADEALALFSEVAELRPPEAFKIKRPKRVDRFVEIEATPNLVSYVGGISDRIDQIQGGKVKPYEDNMLNVITDGRKAALDLELVGVEPDGPGKAGAIAKNVLEVYHRTKDLKLPGDPEGVAGGLQVLFCDLGTPSKDKGSQVYGKIRRYLIDGMPEEGLGPIPRERIKFIHDYNSDLAKEQLFTACRAGEVSVLFSSSTKGATGVNVQTRGVALHHADPPHRPDEWAQREGRLHRPGNKLIDIDMEVEFYRYIALNSFDSYMFQQLERKQRPIVQIMSGQKVGRVIQEIDPVGAGFGMAKAIAAGNPLLMDLANVNGELTVLLNEADGHRQAQARMKRKVEVLSETIQTAEQGLPGMRAMADAIRAAGDDDTWRTADGRLIDPEDVAGVLAQTAQGSKPTLDLDAGYRWRGLNVGFTWIRRQQFNSVAYESWAHLVAGEHQVDVRLNLPWFGKGQSWRIVKALSEAADEAVIRPDEIEQKLAKQRAALEDTRSHIGRPFDRRAELEDVRARKEALEAQISDSAVSSGDESQDGPPFEPGAAGAEMTEAEMAMHDAAVMAGATGGTVIVRSEGQIIGGARVIDHTGTDIRTPDLADLGQYQEALRVLTEAAAADENVTALARNADGEYDNSGFRDALAEWAQDWALERANLPENRPAWLRDWLEPESADTRQMLIGEAAWIVWQQARATAEPEGPPAPEMVETAAILRYYEPLLQRHGVNGAAAAADYITRPGYGFEPDVRNPLYDLVARIDSAADRLAGIDRSFGRFGDWSMVHVGLPRLQASDRLRDVSISLTNVMTGTGTAVGSVDLEAILAAPGTVIDLPPLPESTPTPAPEAETNQDTDAQQTPPTPTPDPSPASGGTADPAPEPENSAPDAPAPDAPPNEGTVTPTTAPADPPASPPGQAPLQDLINTFGDRVMIGHIGGPQPARTHQTAGWAVMAVLSEDQVRGLVSAVAVDGQPVSMEPGTMPTTRVREWIAEQQQAPTGAFFASTSSELPPAMRGDGDVRLSTRADGLTIEQGDVSTTILWEELPAWIDAAVAYDTANRSPSLPAWRHGSLDREIHFRSDERNQSAALALNALAHALRETTPPTDEQLAEARDRFGPPAAPAPAADTTNDVDTAAEESAPQESQQQLPEDAKPVPGAEGYHYTEVARTIRLYTEPGEEVGTAKWSYTKYRYLGDVNGDVVRGTEDGATVAKRMANHHAVVYGDKVHRPSPDDQGRDPVWILHNGSDTLVLGVSPEDETAKAALWTGGGFKNSRRAGGWYLPRTWKEPTRRQRVDDAVRVLAAAGRTVMVHATREERQQPPEPPARLPELNVTPPTLDEVPQFFDAEPFTDQDDLADVQAMEAAYARWGQHPTVRAYLAQDSDARPDGFGTPDNPIAELHLAYHRARLALREPVPGGPDEIVRRVYGVAAWCQALEPAVDEDLLDPLQDLYAAAHHLAARSQATIAVLTAEQTAAAEDAPTPEQAEQAAPATVQQEPGEPAAAPNETPVADVTEEQGPADSTPAAPEPPAAPPEPAPDEDSGLLVVSDEFAILYAARRELMPAGVADDGVTWDTSRIVIGDGGVRADGATVERLMGAGLLEYGATLNVDITPAGLRRINELERTDRPEPAVGDRVLWVATGRVGIVGGYADKEHRREAEVVFDTEGWPNGWDMDVAPLFLVTVEPGAMEPEAAAEAYRVAALRQFPGTLTDPALRGPALEAMTAAALAAPTLAQAARANDLNSFIYPLAAWVDEWTTEQWADVPPADWPEWVRAYFRQGDDAVGDRNGLYAELAGPVYAELRAADPVPDAALTEAEQQTTEAEQQTTEAEQQTTEAESEPEPTPDADPEEQLDTIGTEDSTVAPQETPPEPVPATDVTESAAPEPETAGATDEEEVQLDLFGEPTPAPAQRPGRRRGRREPEPAPQESPTDDPAVPETTVEPSANQVTPEASEAAEGTEETETEKSREQLFQEAVDDLFAGAEPETEPVAPQEEPAEPAPAPGPPADETSPQDAPAPERNEATEAQPERAPEPPTMEPEPAPAAGPIPAAAEEAPAPPGPPAGDPEPTTDRGEMATPPSTTDTDDAVPVEDPPEPQPFTDITSLTADPAYELHLTGVDGQSPTSGELRYGETTIADVRLSASGRWFARLTVDGLPADVTHLNGAPQEAAEQGAVMFAAFTGTPYGTPPGPAVDDGRLTRVDVLRGELRSAALEHLDTITVAVARVDPDYTQLPQFQVLSARLNDLAAAEIDAHGSRQMAANITAVQQAVNAWGGTLPVDPALDERQHLAFPLARMLFDTARMHVRLQATLDAVQAERAALREQQEAAAAPLAPAEPVREESVQQTPPTPAAPEPVRGPVITLGLRESGDGQLVLSVDTVEASQGLVLPGITSADMPGMPLPVTAEVPMLRRAPQQAEQLVSTKETHAWLAEHLVDGPLAQAWNVGAVRERLVVVVVDVLRDGMTPSVDEVAAWLVATAAEQDGLLQAAHDAATVEDFAPAFARAADDLVADGGSEFLVWRYLGDGEGNRRLDVLARATPGAYEQLRALPAPAGPPSPEQAAASTETESPAPSPEVPEDPEMATPARPATPENAEPVIPAAADAGEDSGPGERKPEPTDVAESAVPVEPAPAAEPTGDLPLFTGAESTAGQTEDRPLDIVGEFEAVKEAWDEHVPAERGSGEELFADVQADLASLQQMLADAVAEAKSAPEAPPAAPVLPAPAAESTPSAEPSSGEQEAVTADRDPQKAASAVNTALREADEHAPALQDLPEWQRLQTVRGAFGNLMRVMRERAGEHFGKLMEDGRVGDFVRRASLVVCEKVAEWAQAGANRLRRDDERSTEQRGALPSADALLRLGDAALDYRGPRGGGSTPPPSASGVPDVNKIPEMRKMGEALARPMPGAAKRVSTAAARGRSTTTSKRSAKGAKKSANGSAEQAGHLRRSGEQQAAPKPNQQR